MRFLLPLLLLLLGPSAAYACDVTTPTNVSVGSFSPAALKAGAPPYTKTAGGFSCSSANVLTLLSGNILRATIAPDAALKLTSTTSSDTVSFKLYADGNGTTELKPGTQSYYINGTVLNLLNLGGNGAIDVPVYFKLASSTIVAPGTYKGSFSVLWDWYFCSGIGLLGACIGSPDTGSKWATVNVTLTVAALPPTLSVDIGQTKWNAVEGTSNPKAIPGSKRRITMTVTNPDIVPLDANVVALSVPMPAKLAVALDGDGTGGAVVQSAEGSPASTLTISYSSPSSTSDNVDFSNDGGTTWTYAPTAGDAATQSAVTHVRFRPQGSMAAGSSFSVSVPVSVK